MGGPFHIYATLPRQVEKIPELKPSTVFCNYAVVLTGPPPGANLVWLLVAAPGGGTHGDVLSATEPEPLRILWFEDRAVKLWRSPTSKVRATIFFNRKAIDTMAVLIHEACPHTDLAEVVVRRMMPRTIPSTLRLFREHAHIWIPLI